MRSKKDSEITNAELWDLLDKTADYAGWAVTNSKKAQNSVYASDGDRRQAAKQADQAMDALNAVRGEISRRFN